MGVRAWRIGWEGEVWVRVDGQDSGGVEVVGCSGDWEGEEVVEGSEAVLCGFDSQGQDGEGSEAWLGPVWWWGMVRCGFFGAWVIGCGRCFDVESGGLRVMRCRFVFVFGAGYGVAELDLGLGCVGHVVRGDDCSPRGMHRGRGFSCD
jgi:hypothetical protein